jgi:hypothetical protein
MCLKIDVTEREWKNLEFWGNLNKALVRVEQFYFYLRNGAWVHKGRQDDITFWCSREGIETSMGHNRSTTHMQLQEDEKKWAAKWDAVEAIHH